MSYSISRDRLGKSIDFVDRDIEYRCAVVRELLVCEEEKQALEMRRVQIDRQVDLLFGFGGEQIEKRETLQEKMRQLEEKAESCRAEIPDFEGEYSAYLAAADFLKRQAEIILNPTDDTVLMSVEEPRKLCPELVKWNDEKVDQAFRVKALLLQTFLRGCGPGVERLALAAITEYLELVDLSCYTDKEKNAFLAVIPYLILKEILYKISAGRGKFEKEDRQRMEEALGRVALSRSAYPILLSYQNIFQAGFMEREELLLLGDFYEYFSEKECNGAAYVQAWQVCFKKALHNRSYHPFMRDFLKEGFGKFLRFFDAGGKRCLGDVLGREVIEKRQREGGEGENGQRKPGQGTEILQEYLSCFDGEVRSYLEENSYLQEATKALLKQSAAGALPSVRKLNMHFVWENGRDAWQELAVRCIAEIKESWTEKNLNPVFWDPGRINEIAGEMCTEQRKAGGDERRKNRYEKSMLLVMPLLGIWMGTGKIGCYIGCVLLACVVWGGIISEKTKRNLLMCYALYLVTAVGGYAMGHETTLFYFIWAWSRPSVGVVKKILILAAAVIMPVLLYVSVRGQTEKLRKEGGRHEQGS